MSEDFTTGLMLLAVGMITIFVVLSLVVITGNLLIRFVNQYFPDVPVTSPSPLQPSGSAEISPQIVSAIVGAVDIVTQGAGKITSIQQEK